MQFNFRGERLLQLGLDVFQRLIDRGAELPFHGLHEAGEVGGALGVFDDLDLGERDGLGIVQRDQRIRSVEDTHLLEGYLDRQRESPYLAFVYLRGGVEHNEKGKEQGDEIRVGNEPPVVAYLLSAPEAAAHERVVTPAD